MKKDAKRKTGDLWMVKVTTGHQQFHRSIKRIGLRRYAWYDFLSFIEIVILFCTVFEI